MKGERERMRKKSKVIEKMGDGMKDNRELKNDIGCRQKAE